MSKETQLKTNFRSRPPYNQGLDDVLEFLFQKHKSRTKARELIEYITNNGGSYHESQWKELIEELNISQSQYHTTILKRLRRAGILRKENKMIKLSKTFGKQAIRLGEVWLNYFSRNI
ncbi:MAG: hypothetical protein ABEK17_00925 [Candidatus Aenigmatarchaeota archaeon]